jgi:hypothetical protein
VASPILQLFLDFAGIPKMEHQTWHDKYERERRNGPVQVTHSGKTFGAVGCTPSGHRIWPIEEYLIRSKHKPTVAARIRRMNLYGKVEGAKIRGFHPKFNPKTVQLLYDLVPVRSYKKKWGAAPVRIALKNGRHKFVSRMDFVSGPVSNP